jgi:uncharacterized protein (DUF362 family)
MPSPFNRREFLKRIALASTICGGAGYLTWAPEEYPFSLKDVTGLRSRPEPRQFTLPDYRVATAPGMMEIGIGRDMTTEGRLTKALEPIGGLSRFVQPGDVVLLKPNVAFDRAPELGATTSPELLEVLIRRLLIDCRAKEVRVTDNPIESPADCFAKTGIKAAVERAGGRVLLPDGNAFRPLSSPDTELIKSWPCFYRPLIGVTKVIGVAPVKDHNLSGASMGIKNWYGLLGGQRNQFHQDIHTIIADLSIMIRPTLTILDGSRILMRNGPTGGDPAYVKPWDVIVAGTDQVAMDGWAFVNLLQRDASTLPHYLFLAEEKGGGKIDPAGRIQESA